MLERTVDTDGGLHFRHLLGRGREFNRRLLNDLLVRRQGTDGTTSSGSFCGTRGAQRIIVLEEHPRGDAAYDAKEIRPLN